MSQEGCSGSVTGCVADASGRCHWCKRKVMAALPRPALGPHLTVIDEAYGYVWDPDYGSGRTSSFEGFRD